MVKVQILNSVLNAYNVKERLFGEALKTKNTMNNIGLNYGLLKVIVSDNCINSQDIAHLNLNKLKTIGFTKTQKNNLIIENINTLFMMQPIFTKMAV